MFWDKASLVWIQTVALYVEDGIFNYAQRHKHTHTHKGTLKGAVYIQYVHIYIFILHSHQPFFLTFYNICQVYVFATTIS